jgi:hypothetical protein
MARDKVVTPPAAVPNSSPESADPATVIESDWLEVGGLSKPEAEQMLDWLEVNGFEQRQILVGPDNLFVVRYVPRSLRGPL